jgi:hypothetical protein
VQKRSFRSFLLSKFIIFSSTASVIKPFQRFISLA